MPVVGRAAAIVSNKKTKRRRSSTAARKAELAAHAHKLRTMNIGVRNNQLHSDVSKFFKYRIRDKKWFQTFIIMVIFVAGILVGVQTYDIQDQDYLDVIGVLEEFVVTIFIIELVVKLVAEGRWPWRFFKDAWNVFDFLIVAVGLMPFGGSAVTALRLVRLLRVLKLVRALPKLRILVMGLLKSLSSIAYIGLLLMLSFYLYAVLGVSVFGKNDPIHMGTLHIAFLTLFRCATLEDWTDVMYIGMQGCDDYGYDGNEDLCTNPSKQGVLSVAYFCSFIILSSMMILNLFIGVITSSMADAKSDLSQELEDEAALQRLDVSDEQKMTGLLAELAEILEEVSGDMGDFCDLERQRADTAVLQVSGKISLNNKEMDHVPAGNDPSKLRSNMFLAQELSSDVHVGAEEEDSGRFGQPSRQPMAFTVGPRLADTGAGAGDGQTPPREPPLRLEHKNAVRAVGGGSGSPARPPRHAGRGSPGLHPGAGSPLPGASAPPSAGASSDQGLGTPGRQRGTSLSGMSRDSDRSLGSAMSLPGSAAPPAEDDVGAHGDVSLLRRGASPGLGGQEQGGAPSRLVRGVSRRTQALPPIVASSSRRPLPYADDSDAPRR